MISVQAVSIEMVASAAGGVASATGGVVSDELDSGRLQLVKAIIKIIAPAIL